MSIESLHGLELVVRRARGALASLLALQSRIDRQLVPPLPVPLTLIAFEEWLRAAEDALKRPKIAQSKRLLTGVGIDPASISVDVLGEAEQIKAILDRLESVPQEMKERALSSIGRALTNGLEGADSIASGISSLVTSLQPLLELKVSCAEAVGTILRALPETRKQVT